jgi:hypothetical protein
MLSGPVPVLKFKRVRDEVIPPRCVCVESSASQAARVVRSLVGCIH